MKHFRLGFIYLSLFLLESCTVAPQSLPAPTPSLISNPTITTPVVISLATETPIPATYTPIPVVTSTPLPTITHLPTTTTTPEPPFTEGRIVFLWNQAVPSNIDGPTSFLPTVSLYQALPGKTPEEWTVQPLMANLTAAATPFLSPDKTKLALLVLEDVDGDGNYYESATRDIYKIYVYQFADGSVIRLDNQATLYSLAWLPDNQTIVYPQHTNIFLAKLDGSPPQSLTNNPSELTEGDPYNYISQLAGSPDGRLQAVNLIWGDGLPDTVWGIISRGVAFFDREQGEVVPVAMGTGDTLLTFRWSPNSRWLAFTHQQGVNLFVVDVDTLAVTQLAAEPTSIYYPAWSPDGRWLAFTQSSTLFLWDSETQTTRELTSAHYIGEPAWSSDGATIATGFVAEDGMGLLLIDPHNGNREEIHLGMTSAVVAWSPEDEWLLFHSGKDNQTGLYVVHRSGGEPYLVTPTTGSLHFPSYVIWLPDGSFLP